MARKSIVTTKQDSAGDYEVEIFDHPIPKRIIICSHGNGVRRWDGEKFYYAVAEHYADSAVLLVDQNQLDGDGVKINPLPVLVSRVDGLIKEAKRSHPGVPIILIAHSMGCAVATFVDLSGIRLVVFVAPAAGNPRAALIERYGEDIVKGKAVTTSDGLRKVITVEYCASIKDITSWEEEYAKLIKKFSPVYVFEAGDDEIVGEDRFAHRSMPFTKYEIIEGAKHNFAGEYLTSLFSKLDKLI
jgi:pimeloyl-ACP methyl ester carboxylesterase